MKLSPIIMIAGFVLSASTGAASASTFYDDGLAYFKAGRFDLSARALAAAVARDPASQITRYYLACSLVKARDHRRAVEEYRVAYLLDPTSVTGQYCRKALSGYKAAIPDANEAKRLRQELASRTPASSFFGGGHELAQSMETIRRQADFEKGKHRTDQLQREKIVRGLADAELRAIDQQMEEQIARLSDPIIFTPEPRANPLLIYPELLKQKEDQIRKSAQEEKERILRALDEKTERYKGIQKSRDVALDEVAANLQTQMVSSTRGGVQLQPAGTGLYVRNYLPVGTKPPAEVRSAVVRMVSQGSSDDENGIETKNAARNPEPANSSVTGAVLRPFDHRVVNGKVMLPD
ncbi:MAG: hypothetical protein K2W95_31800 [Candidatus Obscuribacterales bacterium]|nr:hypothetical protein [Candidatus Obscuribacterales bacterium]